MHAHHRVYMHICMSQAKAAHGAGADTSSSSAAELGTALRRAVGAMKEGGGGGRRVLNLTEVAQRLAPQPQPQP